MKKTVLFEAGLFSCFGVGFILIVFYSHKVKLSS